MAEKYLITRNTLQELAYLIKTKNFMDSSTPMSFNILGSKLNLLEDGIYKQIIERNYTTKELTLDIQLRPYMFYNSQGLERLELISNNLKLCPGVFCDSTITELVLMGLDSTVDSIPEKCFRNTAMETLYIPNAEQILSIESQAFMGADFQHVNFLDFTNLTKIGDKAFQTTNMEYYPKFQKIVEVGQRAFYNCKIAERKDGNYFTFFSNVKKIGKEAFDHATIKSISPEESSFYLYGEEIELGDGAFRNFKCDNFDIGGSTFKSIGSNVFRAMDVKNLIYDDLYSDPKRFLHFATLDIPTTASSVFCIGEPRSSWSGDWIYHDKSFYSTLGDVEEITFKPWTFQKFGNYKVTSMNEYLETATTFFYFVETDIQTITKEIQHHAFTQAFVGDMFLGGIETIGERAFYQATFFDDYGYGYKNIQLGELNKPVKNIALNAFEGLKLFYDDNTPMTQLIITVYYDNRDYSETGYPDDYMYGEDGKPLTTEESPLWGISGDVAAITTVIWEKAFPEEGE